MFASSRPAGEPRRTSRPPRLDATGGVATAPETRYLPPRVELKEDAMFYPRGSLETRFWSKVDRSGGPTACWPWLAACSGRGYGHVWVGGAKRQETAHRVAYELLVGPIPAGLTIDHLCRNRRCVNPAHLEPTTMRENTLRGVGATARHARQTHCKNGHEFTFENTYIWHGDGYPRRDCRECTRNRQRFSDAAARRANHG